ncbi:hypothetical protein A7J50_1350 [Pseudomonas antarctica]|uniref:Uncharacterized protein n=1 Tax=Pseudomonas antarctica TaxID=219572 RepID=A0A172YXB8_9PSED|nr:hypothetical protein [Pseudomonas antarctica]ANF84784.1 hypothetical protein A7J50_1350 [Pseudomonas antarctica]
MTIDKQQLQKLLWAEAASFRADCADWKRNTEALDEFLGEKTVGEVALELLAENEALLKLAPSKEIIWCACGDGHAANSYGAGFMDANGGVCQNCDAAQPMVSCPLELFETLRDSANTEADEHRQCMATYRPLRQASLDSVVKKCDDLLAAKGKGEQS